MEGIKHLKIKQQMDEGKRHTCVNVNVNYI